MAKDRSPVRASDIGAWTFCSRAWWLANVERLEHGDPAALAHGNQVHARHGRDAARADWLYRLGLAVIALSLLAGGLLLLIRLLLG